jgi:integrase/recombinase XerD
MLNDLFQKSHAHHRAMPLLGSLLDDFDDWLFSQGYRYSTRQCYVLRCTAIANYFRRRGHGSLSGLTADKLYECWRFYRRRPGEVAVTVRCLQRFLQSRQILTAPIPPPAPVFAATVETYRQYLSEVRGLAPITIAHHCSTAAELLRHVSGEDDAFRLVDLTRARIDGFITSVGGRFGRSSMQHVVGHIRGFLRFLALQGEAPAGLDSQIDTPRVYRMEQLPRALSWQTVCAFLQSIDRTCASGLRDYAMFLLIATYGLRGCDIAGLKLTDIDWRAGGLRVNQSKTRHPLQLPLTDQVAEALLAYLREGRAHSSYRQIFLTVHAPILPIQRQTVGYAFRSRVKRSALEMPFRGVHCLRQSYAVHLLRQGVSLKNIGDVLGHRSTESTCVYLRLNLDDLREVALPLPSLLDQGRTS